MKKQNKIAVIGAGSWGTAISIVLANNGFHVDLFTLFGEQKDEININRTNNDFLPDVIIPSNVLAHTNLEEVLKDKKYIVLVVPSHVMRQVAKDINPYISEENIIIHAAKGIELKTYLRMSEVIHNELPQVPVDNIVVISGPSHAEEVSKQLPTTVVVAGVNINIVEEVQDLFINNEFRVYTNKDIIGTELAGALKNIIALGAGLSDGLGYGDNAKAALITRGLAEISRLGIELKANPGTFSGLAGIGDLIVTCTSKHSRNWRAGYRLGKGVPLKVVLDEMGMVVEGVKATQAAHYLAQQHNIEMPITNELYKVLFENKEPKIAVEDLMGRVKTHEMETIYPLT
ncbi:MAG: NAD(P)H-dependent glycerol-3-phosphate dehydrogenase [Vulcanibacillus sp.]